jgi:hypothetical protein
VRAEPPCGRRLGTAAGDQTVLSASSFRGALVLVWLDTEGRFKGGILRVSLVRPSSTGVDTAANDLPVDYQVDGLDDPRVAQASFAPEASRAGGTILVYTTRADPESSQIRARRWTGSAVDWDVAVATGGAAPTAPVVVGDGRRGAWAGWLDESSETGPQRVRVQHLLDDGALVPGATGLALGSGEHEQFRLRLASDGHGGVFACWIAESSPQRFSYFIQRIAEPGEQAANWPATGRVVCTPRDAGWNARLIADGQGGVYLIWEDWIGTYQQGVRVLRIRADGTNARGWPAEGVLAAVRPGPSTHLEDATADGTGGLLVTLRTEEEASHALVCRLGADGRRPRGWPARGLDASASGNDQSSSRVIGKAGAALLAWSERGAHGVATALCATRFLADGSRAPGWPANGLVLCGTPGLRSCMVLGAGEDGGAILAWTDGWGDSGTNVYAQWVDANGHVGARPR